MTESLGDRVAMPAALRGALTISFENTFVGPLMILFEPVNESWAKVETKVRVIVYDLLSTRRGIVYGGKSVRVIALDVDTLIPIMERRGAGFVFDNSSPWIFARRLIEVAVDYERGHCQKHLATKKHKRHKGGKAWPQKSSCAPIMTLVRNRLRE